MSTRDEVGRSERVGKKGPKASSKPILMVDCRPATIRTSDERIPDQDDAEDAASGTRNEIPERVCLFSKPGGVWGERRNIKRGPKRKTRNDHNDKTKQWRSQLSS